MDDEFLLAGSEKRMTARLSDVDVDAVYAHLKNILKNIGFRITSQSGVHYISKIKEGEIDKDVYVYFPKYRDADYLLKLVETLVNSDGFTTHRMVSNNGNDVQRSDNRQSVNDLISKKSDAIVYRGAQSDISVLEKLFFQLDRPSGEVLVKAVIYEVRKTDSDNNAVAVAVGLLDSVRGLGVRVATGVMDAGNAVKLRFHNMDAAFSILSEDVRFKTVSSPTVRVRSGHQARFQAGAEVPVLGAVTYNGNGQSVQSVDYRSSGVILELTPEIHEDVIDLTITHQLSSFINTVTGVNNSPTLLKRELKTVVTIEDDELLILGGLEENTETQTDKGISFLPDIFRGKRSENERTEIVLVLHVKKLPCFVRTMNG
ncbi:MAG: hypothetical protein LBU45_00405 [Azoarcus sp.]|jgi:type II secretory pathway component GspD/PulD (secretin)|nr:hypothetical protein [Azoarcus sp.]